VAVNTDSVWFSNKTIFLGPLKIRRVKNTSFQAHNYPGVVPWLLWVLCMSLAWSHPDLDLQIDELTEQLEKQPDQAGLLLKRGDLQRRHGNWDLAWADFNRVRQIQADNELLDWFEGRLAVDSGQPELALKYLDRFLTLNPGHGIALQNRAQAFMLLDQPLMAARDLQTVINGEETPGPALYSANALALIKAGSEYYPQAMDVVRDGLVRFHSEMLLTGIATDISLARLDIGSAQDLISKLPGPLLNLPQWQFRRALLDCVSGRRQDALNSFIQLSQDPSKSPNKIVLLQQHWFPVLVEQPGVENCQTAAQEILRDY
jgi:tetratricopeptide (TPR) repeat protein